MKNLHNTKRCTFPTFKRCVLRWTSKVCFYSSNVYNRFPIHNCTTLLNIFLRGNTVNVTWTFNCFWRYFTIYDGPTDDTSTVENIDEFARTLPAKKSPRREKKNTHGGRIVFVPDTRTLCCAAEKWGQKKNIYTIDDGDDNKWSDTPETTRRFTDENE